MSIRKRESKKAPNGYSYQVYFSYYDRYTDEKKMFSKSGLHTYEDAVYYEKKDEDGAGSEISIDPWSKNHIESDL